MKTIERASTLNSLGQQRFYQQATVNPGSIVSRRVQKAHRRPFHMDYARGTISQDFTTTVENLVHIFSRIDHIKDEMNNISGEIEF